MKGTTAQLTTGGADARAPAALVLDEVTAGYGRREILRGLSLVVPAGQIVALLGANGAGKSTALSVALGLLPVRHGSIWLLGEEVSELPPRQRVARGLAHLLQGGHVFPSLSVRENLQLALAASPRPQSGLEPIQDRFPLLRQRLDQSAGSLSGGERRILAYAMAVASEPRVLLLDEPTAGLAPGWSSEVISHLRAITTGGRTAVLLVEQQWHQALAVADQAVLMERGRITQTTSVAATWLQEPPLGDVRLVQSPEV